MKELRKVDGRWYVVTGRGTSRAVRDIEHGQMVVGAKREPVLAAGDGWDAGELAHPNDETPARDVPVTDFDAWRAIAGAIDRGEFVRSHVQPRPIVPITPLRDICAVLRHVRTKDRCNRLAEVWSEKPADLAQLFLRSVADFDDYENDEAFVPASRRDGAAGDESLQFAQKVVSVAQRDGLWIDGRGFRFVDREVSPRRTTRSKYEGETSADRSGAGGLDLLLTDGAAIGVTEIKAKTDVPLLLGLVQTLMYAAELTSPAQRRRLARGYPDELSFLAGRMDGPIADLLLVYQEGSTQGDEVDNVHVAATALLKGPHRFADVVRRHIRQIWFVSTSTGADLTFRLDPRAPVIR